MFVHVVLVRMLVVVSPQITLPPAFGGPSQICRLSEVMVEVVVEPVW